MILTCPRCATRFLVGDDQIPASGREVRCGACDEQWTAFGRGEPLEAVAEPKGGADSPTVEAAEPAVSAEPPTSEPETAAPHASASPAGDTKAESPSPAEPSPKPVAAEPEAPAPVIAGVPALFRPPPPRTGLSREARVIGAGFSALIVLLVVLGLRAEIVRAAPATAGFYAAIGLPAPQR